VIQSRTFAANVVPVDDAHDSPHLGLAIAMICLGAVLSPLIKQRRQGFQPG
jgi:hypothetical protein